MERIVLQETQQPQVLRLPADVAITLAGLDVATFKPQPDGSWRVERVRKVGIVQIAGLQIEIRPKVPVGRLFFMMGYALDREFWLDHAVAVDEDKSLLPALVRAFLIHSESAISRGLIRGYQTREESSSMVRGRLDLSAQITRRGGLVLPAEIIVDEYTEDIPENRMLRSAARILLSLPAIGMSERRRLRHLLNRFDGVSSLAGGSAVPKVHFTRLNRHYRNALGLASLILRYASVEHRAGDTAATAYLFDMWQIFEDFLGATLKASLEGRGGVVELQRTGECLDEGSLLALRPDIVWSQSGGVRAVLDAKYKAVRFEQYPNPDVYQMLAYCVRYGLSDGHLIYASGEEQPRIHQIMGMGTRIHCHAVDLDRSPEEMLASIKSLAQLI